MADMPGEIIIPDQPPVTNVGVDHFGHIEVKRGRVMVKRNIHLYGKQSCAFGGCKFFRHGFLYECHKEICVLQRSSVQHEVRQ